MANVYLELEGGSGKMFQYSKTEQDGYVKYISENPTTKAQSISYRKYFPNGVFGNLVGFSSREKKMGDKSVVTLSVVLDNPVHGNTYFLTLPLFTQRNTISDYAMSILRVLPELESGSPYRVNPYAFENKDFGGRKNYGVTVSLARLSDDAYDDVNKIPQLSFEVKKLGEDGELIHTPGDIPAIDWEKDFKDKNVPNSSKRDKYLWDVLKKYSIAFSGGSGGKGNTFNSKEDTESSEETADQKAPAKTSKTKAEKAKPEPVKPAPVQEEDEDDDLPF